MTSYPVGPGDVQLAQLIIVCVVAVIVIGWLANVRAARGNRQVEKYDAELSLMREDRTAWREAVNALRSDMDGRMRSLEEHAKHAPTGVEFEQLRGEVRTLGARYDFLLEGQQRVLNTLARIEDYLLKGKKP